jgi:isoamylase
MTSEEWNAGWIRCIGLKLNGRTLDDLNGVGEPIRDESFMFLLNPHHEPIRFYMPDAPGTAWEVIVSSAEADGDGGNPVIPAGEFWELIPRSTALLRELAD